MARMAPKAPDARQLSDLLELSQTLGATLNLRQALQRVLAILEESRGTLSGTIVLRDEPASDLVVEAASGAGGIGEKRALPARRGHRRARGRRAAGPWSCRR